MGKRASAFDYRRTGRGGKGLIAHRLPKDGKLVASFPIGDSVLKGTMVITVQQDCTLLATKYELWLYVKKDGVDAPNLVRAEQDQRVARDAPPGAVRLSVVVPLSVTGTMFAVTVTVSLTAAQFAGVFLSHSW